METKQIRVVENETEPECRKVSACARRQVVDQMNPVRISGVTGRSRICIEMTDGKRAGLCLSGSLSCSRCFERLDLGEDWARWSRLTARYKTEKRVGGLTVLAIWQSLPATSLLVVSVDDPNERTRSVRGPT